MKKSIIALSAFLMLTIGAFAQSPAKFNYQSICRDADGLLIENTQVSVRISILQGSSSGSEVYSEEHSPTTNDFGLMSLQVGSGSNVSGDLATIDWGGDSYWIQVEFDENGGSSYSVMSSSELVSVPYALMASHVENDSVDDADNDPMNEIQTLSLVGDSLMLTDGGSVDLSMYDQSAELAAHVAADMDTDSTNELITNAELLNDSTLRITEAGADHDVDLSSLIDDDDWVRDNDSTIFNADDNVGIGTELPQASLHVANTSDAYYDIVSGDVIIGNSDSMHIAIDNNDILAKNYSDSTGRLFLQRAGKLSVGSWLNPAYKTVMAADQDSGAVMQLYRHYAGGLGLGLYVYDNNSQSTTTYGAAKELMYAAGTAYGSYNRAYSPGSIGYGSYNSVEYGASTAYGTYNNIYDPTGVGYGVYNNMYYGADQYGVYNNMYYSDDDAWGMYNYIYDAAGDAYGQRNYLYYSNYHYGSYNYSYYPTYYGYGAYNYARASNSYTQYGAYNYAYNTGSGYGYGAYNYGYSSTGSGYGAYNYGRGNSTYDYGYGAYNTGRSYGTYGRAYGSYNYAYAGSSYDYAYGSYNYASGGYYANYGSYTSGYTYSTSGYYSSDRKLKTNIRDYDNALGDLMELKPRVYDFDTESYPTMGLPEEEQLGLVAQELEEVFPNLIKMAYDPKKVMTEADARELGFEYEVVSPAEYDQEGNLVREAEVLAGDDVEFKAVNYNGLIPVLIKAVQEQQEIINQLEERIEQLED